MQRYGDNGTIAATHSCRYISKIQNRAISLFAAGKIDIEAWIFISVSAVAAGPYSLMMEKLSKQKHWTVTMDTNIGH